MRKSKQTKAVAGAVVTTFIGWLMAWGLSSVEAGYVFYWVFGSWLPWYGSMVMGLFCPIVLPAWVLLWLAHFVPAIIWPLVK